MNRKSRLWALTLVLGLLPGLTLAADDIIWSVEYSTDLVNWHTDALIEAAPHGSETWRVQDPLLDHVYWRARVSLR